MLHYRVFINNGMSLTEFSKITIFLLSNVFFCSNVCADEDDDLYLINDDFGPNEFAEKVEEREKQYLDCELDEEGFDIVESCSDDESFLLSWMDTPQNFIASSINSLATSIDDFFVDDKNKYKLSGSYLRITYDTIFIEGGIVENVSDVNFKLTLPNTEERLKLSFESDFEDDKDSLNTPVSNLKSDKIEDEDYFASLQSISKGSEHWRFRSALGAKLGATSDVFLKLNLDWNNNLGKWNFHWNENPFWFNSSGWGLDSLFEINRNLSGNTVFRAATFSRWTEELDYFESSEVFSISHTFSPKRAIIYQAGVYGVSDPNIETTSYLLAIRYRKNIHKDYLFAELIPQIDYQKDNNFAPVHSVTLKLEWVFNG